MDGDKITEKHGHHQHAKEKGDLHICMYSMYSYCCLCIVIVVYVFLDVATLTEVFPCFFLSCKANARV